MQRIVAIDPEKRDALFRLGLFTGERGDHTQAEELVQRLRRRDPQRAQELEATLRSVMGSGR